jgi:Putative peptidoglycan binding domain
MRIVFLPLVAFASNVSVTQDVTIVLPSDSSQYLLKASSSFDTASVAIDPSSFSLAMNPADTVTITSADNRTLANTLNISTTCGSPSTVRLTVQSSQTVTVTPGGTCVASSGTGSTGGSGMVVSSGPLAPGYINANPISTSTAGGAIASTSTSSAVRVASGSTGTSATTTAPHLFTHNLSYRMVDPDVLKLQHFLNTHGLPVAQTGAGSRGQETTLFGIKTYQALKKFQQAHGLPSTGFLGPLTRALMQ